MEADTEQRVSFSFGHDDLGHPAVVALQEGLAAKQAGLFHRALRLYEEALTQASVVRKDARLEGAALLNLGNLYRMLGDYETSWAYYVRAGKLAQEHYDVDRQAHVAMAMAGLAWELGDYDTALNGYQEAHDRFKGLNNVEGIATALHNAASVYQALGDLDTALQQYQKALELAVDAHASTLEAQVLCQIGSCLVGQGLAFLAKEPLTKALEIALRLGNVEKIGNALHNLGVAEVGSGECARGTELLQQAMCVRLELSLRAPTSRLRIASRQPCIRSLMQLVALFCEDGRWEEAINTVELVRAREVLTTAIGKAESRSRSGDTETVAELVAARTELRNLIDQLESHPRSLGGEKGLRDQELSLLLEHYQEVLFRIANLERKLDTTMFEQIPFTPTVGPAHRLALHPSSSSSLVLTFLPTCPESQLAVVTTRGGKGLCENVHGDKDTVLGWSELHADAIECLAGGVVAQARRLLKELVDDMSARMPLKALCEQSSQLRSLRVALIPWGAMHDLPLEALLVRGSPLGLQWPLVRAFSLQQATRREGSSGEAYALVIADPTRGIRVASGDFGISTLDYSLPAAYEEGQLVKNTLEAAGWKVDTLHPEECSTSRITELLASSQHRLIHFAGHVVSDPYFPERTGLMVRADDGVKAEVLSAEALQHMGNLRGAPLFVLSACRSGGLAMRTGNESTGLLQAVLSAGASCVLATGWPVTDHGAKAFMAACYASLAAGKDVAEAVLAARLAVYEPTAASSGPVQCRENSALGNIEEWAAFKIYGGLHWDDE